MRYVEIGDAAKARHTLSSKEIIAYAVIFVDRREVHMARKKKNIVAFKPYETLTPNGNEKGYLRLTKSLWCSDALKDVTRAAVMIYIDMRMVANGHDEVIYTQAMAYKSLLVSKETYKKSMDELERVGLIKKKPRSCYSPNSFEFVSGWKTYVSKKRDGMTGEFVKTNVIR